MLILCVLKNAPHKGRFAPRALEKAAGCGPGIGLRTRPSCASVTAEAFYPESNATWTEQALSSYGGTLIWTATSVNHTAETLEGVAPTCTETGLTEGRYCALCGEAPVVHEIVPATGHEAVPAQPFVFFCPHNL